MAYLDVWLTMVRVHVGGALLSSNQHNFLAIENCIGSRTSLHNETASSTP